MTARALLTREQIADFRESLHEHEETVPLCSFEIDALCDMAHLATPEVEPVGMPEEPKPWRIVFNGSVPMVLNCNGASVPWKIVEDELNRAYASARTVSEERIREIAGKFAATYMKNDPDAPAIIEAAIGEALKESASPPVSEWRDIESAPKSTADGNRVEGVYLLGYCPEPDISNLYSATCIIWWEPLMNNGKGMWYGEGGYEVHPTHWQPLTAPPSQARAGEGE